MTPEKWQAIKGRDAETSTPVWFEGPPSFTALAARDRRELIAEVEPLTAALKTAQDSLRIIASYTGNDSAAFAAKQLALSALAAMEPAP